MPSAKKSHRTKGSRHNPRPSATGPCRLPATCGNRLHLRAAGSESCSAAGASDWRVWSPACTLVSGKQTFWPLWGVRDSGGGNSPKWWRALTIPDKQKDKRVLQVNKGESFQSSGHRVPHCLKAETARVLLASVIRKDDVGGAQESQSTPQPWSAMLPSSLCAQSQGRVECGVSASLGRPSFPSLPRSVLKA